MIVKTAAHLHSAVAVLGVIMVIEVYR